MFMPLEKFIATHSIIPAVNITQIRLKPVIFL